MRKIIISESQLALLEKLVKEEDGVLLNNGYVKEFGDSSQIGTSATITNSDGDPEPGEDVASDEVSKMAAYQGYFGNPRSRF